MLTFLGFCAIIRKGLFIRTRGGDNIGKNRDIVDGLSVDVLRSFLSGMGSGSAFSALVISGPEAVSEDEKEMLKASFATIGLNCETNEDLYDAARSIAKRSVRLR